MTAQHFILCDGTGNSPEADVNGTVPDNVQVLRDLLGAGLHGERAASKDLEQGWENDRFKTPNGNDRSIYYLRGLGAPPLDKNGKVLGVSFKPSSFFTNPDVLHKKFQAAESELVATGILDKVAMAYKYLVLNYKPGDEVYMLGFSRGSYTLRLLVTLIRYIGLIDRDKFVNAQGNVNQAALNAAIEEAFNLYNKDMHPDQDDNPALAFRNKNGIASTEHLVTFLGLWDCVAGPEDPTVKDDRKLSSVVHFARHALAIDENRPPYRALLWVRSAVTNSVQKWFRGCHCDVGGSYKERGLSNVTLHWMIAEMQENCKVYFDPESLENPLYKPDPNGPQHDSYNGQIQTGQPLTYKDLFPQRYFRKVGQTAPGEEYISKDVLDRLLQNVSKIANDISSVIKYESVNLARYLIAAKNADNLPHRVLSMTRDRAWSDELNETAMLLARDQSGELQANNNKLTCKESIFARCCPQW